MDGLFCLVLGAVSCVCVAGGLEIEVHGDCIGLLIPEIDCCRNGFFEMVRPAIR